MPSFLLSFLRAPKIIITGQEELEGETPNSSCVQSKLFSYFTENRLVIPSFMFSLEIVLISQPNASLLPFCMYTRRPGTAWNRKSMEAHGYYTTTAPVFSVQNLRLPENPTFTRPVINANYGRVYTCINK